MDIQPSKKNIYKSKIRQCKTGEIIDMVAGYCEVDLKTFKTAMGTEKPMPVYGFTKNTDEAPYEKKRETKSKTRYKTYKEIFAAPKSEPAK